MFGICFLISACTSLFIFFWIVVVRQSSGSYHAFDWQLSLSGLQFLSYLTKVVLTLVTYENYTTKVILLQIWTENNFVVTLISYMKQPMVIYPVILHGDTALPPACLISKLWLWCFKLYTQHFVFIHTLWIIQMSKMCRPQWFHIQKKK